MITSKKINNFEVKKVNLGTDSGKPFRGEKVMKPYQNCFITARKHSGKSTTIFALLKAIVGRDTEIHFFVGTLYRDKMYEKIREYFTKKGNVLHLHTAITDENGLNLVSELRDVNNDEESEEEPENSILNYLPPDEIEEEPQKKRKRKSKYQAVKHVAVFDDLGSSLRSPEITRLLKVNRHLLMTVLLSSQYLLDLAPGALRNCDSFICFNGFKKAKLQKLMIACDTDLPYSDFNELYEYATADKYNFLMIDTSTNPTSFRKNFNHQLTIS